MGVVTRTHEKVSGPEADGPGTNGLDAGSLEEEKGLPLACYPTTSEAAALGVERVLGVIDGRWKLEILFNLFGGRVRRFSELERAIPGVSQKMLAQQLRQLEHDGLVHRTVHQEVPPKVEYALTPWGQSLCPALDALLRWATAPGAEPPPAGSSDA